MINLTQIRLQYEILNKSFESLAIDNGLPVSILKQEADEHNWKQFWPEPDLLLMPDVDRDERLTAQSEAFIDRSKRRLAAYNVAKEVYLAQKYFELESGILDAALTALQLDAEMRPSDIKELSALYRDLMANSIAGALSSMSFGEDDTGLPTVIIKDLSGTTTRRITHEV